MSATLSGSMVSASTLMIRWPFNLFRVSGALPIEKLQSFCLQKKKEGIEVRILISSLKEVENGFNPIINFLCWNDAKHITDKKGKKLDEKGTAYPATVDTLRKIVKDKQHQTVMFKSGQAIVDLFTASAMVQVYDALKKPDMKKTFEKMITDKAGFMKTQAFAMKMIGK